MQRSDSTASLLFDKPALKDASPLLFEPARRSYFWDCLDKGSQKNLRLASLDFARASRQMFTSVTVRSMQQLLRVSSWHQLHTLTLFLEKDVSEAEPPLAADARAFSRLSELHLSADSSATGQLSFPTDYWNMVLRQSIGMSSLTIEAMKLHGTVDVVSGGIFTLCPSLCSLQLRNILVEGGLASSGLSTLTGLTRLELCNCWAPSISEGNKGVVEAVSCLTALRRLQLDDRLVFMSLPPLGLSHLTDLDISECPGLRNQELSLLSELPALIRLSVNSLDLLPDWQPAKGLPSHLGLPSLRHLRITSGRRPQGVAVRQLAWLLGANAQLETLSPSPVRLGTGCCDLDQAATLACMLQLLQGPLLGCCTRLSLAGMLGFSGYNAHYMFRLLQPSLGHVTELTLARATLDAECTLVLASALPSLRRLVLEHCEIKGGALDGLQGLKDLAGLSLFGCSGAAVGYPASLAFFGRSLQRSLDLAVDEATLTAMRASAEELRQQIRQHAKDVNLELMAGC